MNKILFGTALVLALLIGQTGAAFAQDITPINSIVQSVTLETDTTGTTTVLVTYTQTDSAGVLQTITSRLSVGTAASLGLVTTDPATNTTTVNSTATGSTIIIDPATVLPDSATEEPQHPVGSALGDFFSETLGVDYETIMEYHGDGTGFGVIAQALWMTNQLGGDSTTFAALLDAKKSGDYSAITLADGSMPKNWGDVVKSLKKGDNLGSVKSGRANPDNADASTTKQNGNDNNNEKSGGNSGGKNDGGKENGKSGGKGNGKP